MVSSGATLVADESSSHGFSSAVAVIYIYNVIVGAGCLALPLAFNRAGLILGSILIFACGLVAFVSVTFVMESLSSANAIQKLKESQPLKAEYLQITKPIEVGEMAAMFLGTTGRRIFYFVIVIYLFGDLSIYSVSTAKTMAQFCIQKGWTVSVLSDFSLYRLFLALFALCIGPLCFASFENTKTLQYGSMIIRNVAFFCMIVLACRRLIYAPASASRVTLSQMKLFDLSQLPAAFGGTIYSYMCHHSIPSLVAPIRKKGLIGRIFLLDYMFIASSYLLLCVSAMFAFLPGQLSDLYSLDFVNDSGTPPLLASFLEIVPAVCLTSNFPLFAITLRNNLAVVLGVDRTLSASRGHVALTLLAILPPFTIAFFDNNVESLVSFTGGFAGLFIEFVLPALLVQRSRAYWRSKTGSTAMQQVDEELKEASSSSTSLVDDSSMNLLPMNREKPHASFFSHWIWPQLVLGFAAFSFLLVSAEFIMKYRAL